jgi:hypothetical protein
MTALARDSRNCKRQTRPLVRESVPHQQSPLLEAVARERLAKTQQAGKGVAVAVVICELWRLAVAL